MINAKWAKWFCVVKNSYAMTSNILKHKSENIDGIKKLELK